MTLPLEGLTVVDMTRHLPGPYATMLLSDMGATVWKVEHPEGGDVARQYPPYIDGEGAFFVTLNRDKQSVTLDLKADGASDVLHAMLGEADVFVESFRPGVLERLGVSIDEIRAKHSDLVTCSMTGFGWTGPESDRAGHDLTYAARAGLLERFRQSRDAAEVASPPVIPRAQFADLSGALFAATRIVGTLLGRARHGERGEHLDISLTESALSLLAPHVTAEAAVQSESASDLLGGDRAAYTIYRTADDRHLAVGGLEPKFWQAFIEELNAPELATDGLVGGEAGEVARGKVADIIEEEPLETWLERFEGVDACVEPVQTLLESLEDELFRGREAIFEVAGASHVRTPATPAARDLRETSAAPALGADTDEVLRSVGYSDDELDSMKSSGIC